MNWRQRKARQINKRYSGQAEVNSYSKGSLQHISPDSLIMLINPEGHLPLFLEKIVTMVKISIFLRRA
jgi:hypothetical protein